MTGVIYEITCRANGKRYVGQTRFSVEKRWRGHCREALAGRTDTRLSRAIRKYGSSEFVVAVIEHCDIAEMNERETFWIAKLDTVALGYNANTGGDSPVVFAPDRNAKISAKLKGCIRTPEHRAAISATLKGRTIDDPATLKRMGDGHRGLMRSDETKARMRASQLGKKHSTESCAKMSASRTGRKQTPEHIAKRADARRGKRKPCTPERRANIIAGMSKEGHRRSVNAASAARALRSQSKHNGNQLTAGESS